MNASVSKRTELTATGAASVEAPVSKASKRAHQTIKHLRCLQVRATWRPIEKEQVLP